MTISALVYIMCALTSTLCTVQLYRTYRENSSPLLFWSGICFFCLALNNVLVVVDLVLTPTQVDLSVLRIFPAVVGFAALAWGFIWST